MDAIGTTKGRGFEGVMKRHHFAAVPPTHGHKGWHRRPGAIGERLFPGTVLRGMRMPGHMGQVTPTTQNLEVIQVREADNAPHQGRHPRLGRRLRRHSRVQETPEGLEAPGGLHQQKEVGSQSRRRRRQEIITSHENLH